MFFLTENHRIYNIKFFVTTFCKRNTVSTNTKGKEIELLNFKFDINVVVLSG